MEQNIEAQKAILAALNRAIISVGKVHKEGKNPMFSSTYATLENVLDTINPILHGEGLAISQSPSYDASQQAVTMGLSFIDPQGNAINYCTSALPVGKIYKKNGDVQEPNAQTAVAAQTYLARTQLSHVFRLNLSDDDGAEAVGYDRGEVSNAPARAVQPLGLGKQGGAPERWEADTSDEPGEFSFKGKRHKLKEMTITQLSTVSWTGNFPDDIRELCKLELHRRKNLGDEDATKALVDNAKS